MASISPVELVITDQSSDEVLVQVRYTIRRTHHDAEHEQAYHEMVELIGVDTGEPGEDGVDDILPIDKVSDGVVVFTANQQEFTRSPHATFTRAELDEDSHPFLPRSDEIRARVTLTPLPPTAPSRESNLVRREQIVGPIA
jgi:hypothetical protein